MKQKRIYEYTNEWLKENLEIKIDRYKNQVTFGTEQQLLNRWLDVL